LDIVSLATQRDGAPMRESFLRVKPDPEKMLVAFYGRRNTGIALLPCFPLRRGALRKISMRNSCWGGTTPEQGF
jgi:hypothetical protein